LPSHDAQAKIDFRVWHKIDGKKSSHQGPDNIKASIKEAQSALIPELIYLGRKNIRYLFTEMAEQCARLMEAIGWRHNTYERMEACGTMDENGNNMRLCGVPFCPRCFMVKRGRETGKTIKKHFAGTANDDMAFLTLQVPSTFGLGSRSVHG
jgi:hypothetical protein